MVSFYCAMLCSVRLCYSKLSVVCLSVCLSVTMRYDYHIGWNTSKITSRLISLGSLMSLDTNIVSLFQWEHHRIFAGIGVGYENGFRHTKTRNISETRQNIANR